MLTLKHWESVDQIPSDDWDSLAPRQAVGLELAHLRAVERAHVSNVEPHYVMGFDGTKPVGIAHFFLIDLDLASLSKEVDPATTRVLRAHDPAFLRLRTIECGFVAGLGEAIAADPMHFAEFVDAVAAETEETGRRCNADIILFRDVRIPRLENYRPLLRRGYRALWGFPMAVMPIRWHSFDEFLASLKTGTRRNVRCVFEGQRDMNIACSVRHDFSSISDELAGLWSQTNLRSSDYQHEQLNPIYFSEIGRQLGHRAEAIVARSDERNVGMALNVSGDREYTALHLGLDQSFMGEEVYHSIMLHIIERAIEGHYQTLNIGITCYDIKFRFGAQADPVAYFVRHVTRPELTSSLARMMGKSIVQPENCHRPFAGQSQPLGVQPSALPALLSHYQGDLPESDVFRKAYFHDRFNEMRITKLHAFCPPFDGVQDPVIEREGKPVIMLGSNSYLGLASHPKVKQAAHEAIDKYGTGCSGSPVLNGTLDLHLTLALELAEFFGKEDALTFSTGYQTNLGVVSTLVRDGDVLIMDELDHASLIDGALLSRSRIVRYRHNNMEMLESLLERYKERPKLVVVDSVFSMEGTIANIPEIVRLSKAYGARLMLDEAHGIGVLGPNGRGAAEHFGLLDQVDLIMGTFSKSFASIGGFVAGEAWVIDYLRYNSRAHLFSASLPPSALATVREALKIVQSEPERRTRLLGNARLWSQGLQQLGYDAPYNGTAIVPVQCGPDVLALGMYYQLLRKGVFVNPVLPPAVPKGRSLLRTSLMATHDQATLERALRAFAEAVTIDFPVHTQPHPDGGSHPISGEIAIHREAIDGQLKIS